MIKALSITFVWALSIALASSATAADKPVLRAGAATSNITPPIGQDIIGGFAPSPSKHIHDELNARCLVLDDGKTRLAIVVCDLLGLHKIVSDEARRLIQERTGIPRENVLISGTHTHSGSSALGQDRLAHEQKLDEYQTFVAIRISDGVQRALNLLRPAQIGFGFVDVPEHLNNRRWFMRPGTVPDNPFGTSDLVKMNPPGGSPNLVEPAGPVDPEVAIVSVREPDGQPISVFATYSLHYVGGVGPAHVSADYFGMFCNELTRLLGAEQQDPPFVGLLANGTSGDVNNINFRTPRKSKGPYEQMRFVAGDVAAKVHAALAGLKYRDDATLGARYREAKVAFRKLTSDELAWAKKTAAERKPEPGKTDLSLIYANRALKLAEYPDLAELPLQTFRIGDVCLGTMPCEVFTEIGLDFKRRSAIKPAFMVSLNHGYYGYLPTPRHFDLGGYETWIGTNRLERTASDKMMAELVEMSSELQSAAK